MRKELENKVDLCVTIQMLLNQLDIARGERPTFSVKYIKNLEGVLICKENVCEYIDVKDYHLESFIKEIINSGSTLLVFGEESKYCVDRHELRKHIPQSVRMILKLVTLAKNKDVDIKVKYDGSEDKAFIIINDKESFVEIKGDNCKQLATSILSAGFYVLQRMELEGLI